MTHLELVARIGSDSIDMARMYLRGALSVGELQNLLGRERAELICQFACRNPYQETR